MNKMKKCILCGKEYEYCPKCSSKNLPRWMSLYDSDNCRKIFNLASDYYGGDTMEELKQQIKECDLSEVDKYSEDIQKAIAAIKAATKTKRNLLSE